MTEYEYIYKWDVSATGWAFKDAVVATNEHIVTSTMIPPGFVYLVGSPCSCQTSPVDCGLHHV